MGYKDDGGDIQAYFSYNHRGEARIAFSDPVYARADSVLLEQESGALHVIVHERAHYVGQAPERVMHAFENNRKVLLTATRPDGRVLEFMAPVSIRRQSEEAGRP